MSEVDKLLTQLNSFSDRPLAKSVVLKLLKETLSMQVNHSQNFMMMAFRGGLGEEIKYSALVALLTSSGKEKLFSTLFEDLLELELSKWTSLGTESLVFQTACSRTLNGTPLILNLSKPSLIGKLCLKRPLRESLLQSIETLAPTLKLSSLTK